MITLVVEKIFTLAVVSFLLVKGQSPAWFAALLITVAVFQLCGTVLLKTFRPLAVANFQPTPLGRVTSLLLRVWLGWKILSFVRGWFAPSTSPLEVVIWLGLAGLQVFTFFQYFQRSASQLLPLTVLRTRR